MSTTRIAAALWAALVAAHAPALAQPAPVAAPEPTATGVTDIEIKADLLEAQRGANGAEAGEITASGNVQVRTGELVLRAPRLELDRESRHAVLEGGVVAVDGLLVLTADSLELDLANEAVRLRDGRLVVKRGVRASELLSRALSDDPASAARAGTNDLTVRAERIVRADGPGFTAEDVWLTTCACDAGCRPFLSVSSRRVRVTPGERASLDSTWFRIFDVPLLWVPRISLPLSSRASGLLFPKFANTETGGFTVEQPLFVTLGDSADLTLRARWFAGTGDAAAGRRGVSGFGDDVELRWRPAAEAAGRLLFTHVHDTSPGPGSGDRGAVALSHAQGLAGGRLVVAAEGVSDTSFLFDAEPVLQRSQLPYLRSVAGWSLASRALGLAVSSTALQVLDARHTSFEDGPGAIAPLARAALQGQGALGPVALSGTGTLRWEDSLAGASTSPAHRSRVLGSLALAQTAPIASGLGGALALEAGERVDLASSGTSSESPLLRGGAYAGLVARTRLEGRVLGLLNEILPSIQLRGYGTFGPRSYAPSLFASGTAAPQAPVDVALPPGYGAQLVTRLATSFLSEGRRPFGAWAEHHAGAGREGAAQAFAFDRGQLQFGFDADLTGLRAWAPRLALAGMWDLETREFATATARVSGTASTLRYGAAAQVIEAAQSDAYARPLDALFAPALARSTNAATRERLVTGNLSADVPAPFAAGLRLQAVASITRRGDDTPTQDYTGGFTWDAGGCATIGAYVRWSPGADTVGLPIDYGATFDLGDVAGGFGSALASALP